ncbi:MAG: PolC-type DNA polymerase III [Candidatus Muiribacteriota bacterium]
MSNFIIELEEEDFKNITGESYSYIVNHQLIVDSATNNIKFKLFSSEENFSKINISEIEKKFLTKYPGTPGNLKINLIKPKSNIKDVNLAKENIIKKVASINGRTKLFPRFAKNIEFESNSVKIIIEANYLNTINDFVKKIEKICRDEFFKYNSSKPDKVLFETFENKNIFPDIEPEVIVYEERPVQPRPKPVVNNTKKNEFAYRNRRNKNYSKCDINTIRLDTDVSVKGKILHCEDIRATKNGKFIHSYILSDKLDSVYVKSFEKEEKPLCKKGQFVEVKGRVKYDEFQKETVIYCDEISESEPETRMDNYPEKRVELHLHTKMSMDDATCDINETVALAAKWGHKAIAITDHAVVQGFPVFYNACKKNNIKPIFGVEGYLFTGDENNFRNKASKDKTFHIIILVKNNTGRKNLYKIISESHLNYFYSRPLIPLSIIEKYKEGLIFGSACERGELFRAVLNKKSDEEIAEIAQRYDFFEIQPITNNKFLIRQGVVADEEELRNLNRQIVNLGEKFNKPVVATCDTHFLDPWDFEYRKVLQATKGYADFMFQPELYLRTTDEMLEEFSYLGEEKSKEVCVDNTVAISELIEEFKPIPDGFYPPSIENAEENLVKMVNKNAEEIYGNPLPEVVRERIDFELDSIIKYQFSTLFFLAHLLVKRSLDDGYLVGSRGSVGSSAVARFSNITEVNPLPPHYVCENCKYSEFFTDIDIVGVDLEDKNCPKCQNKLKKDGFNIPFQVFMGFEGDKVPDIDLNFSGEYQSVIHKYVEELFGSSHTFKAGTISMLKEGQGAMYLKKYLERISDSTTSLKKSDEIRIVKGIEGVKKTTGQHPGGVIVVPKNMEIYDFSPVNYPANKKETGVITTHFDYHVMDAQLVKLDMLGHDDPTIIKHLQEMTGVDIFKIPLDDKETMKFFTEVRSTAIPEFGTNFVKRMLEDTRPTKFTELIRLSGLSHGTDVWTNNAQELIRSQTADLANVISVRDDIMNYLINKGLPKKLSFDIMEHVRKGKGLKPEMEELMKKHQVPDWYIDSCKKIKYMFPKAHAVAYVVMAYRIAWFKANYPREFYSAYFGVRTFNGITSKDIVQGKKYVIDRINILRSFKDASATDKSLLSYLEVALEAMERGIDFIEVDLYKSDYSRYKLEGENSLRCPLISLEGLGEKAAMKICEEREKKPFRTQQDLVARCGLNKNVLALLREKNCMGNLPETDNLSLF